MTLSVFIDEKNAPLLKKYHTIAGICDPAVQTTMFVTSTEWGQFVDELEKLPPEIFTDPTRKMTKATFSRLSLGNLTVVNSGTEDQATCDAANMEAARKANFRNRLERFAIRRGTKKEIEAVDAEETHARPDDVIAEAAEMAASKYRRLTT